MSERVLPSPTFCVLPWVSLATNSAGQFRVCCHALPGLNQIKDSDGRTLRIDRDDLAEVWSSPTYAKIRSEMLGGQEPEMCVRCFREERSGIASFRQNMNERFLATIDPAIDARGVAKFDVRYVDLRLGNLCNLRCRMCNPFASNQWLKEWNGIAERKLSEREIEGLQKMSWPEDPQVWRQLESILDTVEEIYLTGGEPMIINEQTRLLEKCVALGISKRITLKYNTNLTFLPERLIELWGNFKRVKINASVDGWGPLNDYIRHPSRWELVEKNLLALIELAKNPRFRLQVHTTVQVYNVLGLTPLFEFLRPHGIFPYLNILDRPAYLNVRVLPQDLKVRARRQFEAFADLPKVDGLMRYLDEDWSAEWPKLRAYTARLDAGRGESLRNVNPQLADALAD